MESVRSAEQVSAMTKYTRDEQLESQWTCRHCNREIKDKSNAWSRSRIHWCSKSCFDQDYPIRRDKRTDGFAIYFQGKRYVVVEEREYLNLKRKARSSDECGEATQPAPVFGQVLRTAS